MRAAFFEFRRFVLLGGCAELGAVVPPLVGEGEAVRIDTGAPIPAGADAVVPIENCIVSSSVVVRVLDPARASWYEQQGLRTVCPTKIAIEMLDEAVREGLGVG